MYTLLRRASAPSGSYCYDCTHAYKAEMTKEGRCRHPEAKFEMVEGAGELTLHALRVRSPGEEEMEQKAIKAFKGSS